MFVAAFTFSIQSVRCAVVLQTIRFFPKWYINLDGLWGMLDEVDLFLYQTPWAMGTFGRDDQSSFREHNFNATATPAPNEVYTMTYISR